MKINNVRVYGLEESIIASSYPMIVDTPIEKEFENDVENIKYWFDKEIADIIEILNNNKNYIVEENYVEIPVDSTFIKLSYEDLVRFHEHKWYYNQTRGYIVMTKHPYTELHRFIANNPKDMDVDHINRVKNDYRRENLRICTRQQNTINRDILPTNKSGITGVYYRKDRDKWVARIEINGKAISLGNFDNKEDAVKKRLEAEKEYFGEFAPQRHLFEQYGIISPKENNISPYLIIKPNIRKAINDYKRIKTLAQSKIGSGHNCFAKGIIVQYDLTAPEYFWRQFDRYHFHDYISSQSKMHRLLKMDLNKMCNKYVDQRVTDIVNDYITTYNEIVECNVPKEQLKELFQQIVSNCPMGLELTARITDNYLQLKSKYHQRKNHKLEEWQYYCNWIKTLPMSKELIVGEQ